MKTRQLFALVAPLVVLSLLLTACAGAPPSPTPAPPPPPTVAPTTAPTAVPTAVPTKAPPTPTTAPTATPQPFKPVFMTINLEQTATFVRNFNPFSPDTRMQSNNGVIYEPLMIYNKATGKLVPWLATEYVWSENNTVLTFKIRQGVKWSDGQPFTAKDVVFSFDLVKKNPALLSNLGDLLTEYIESYSASDDFTVRFKFKVVYTPALHTLANQLIVPEHIWKDVKDPATFANEKPVGTGPFTEVTKFENQIYVIEKNPNYWQPGKPYFQGLRFPAYPDNDTANMALANGELDWAGNFVPDADKTYVAKNPKDFYYFFVGGDVTMLYINTNLKPFDNAEVRKAISMGIDRKKIINVAMFDYVPPADATGLSDQFKTWLNPKAVEAGAWVNYDPKAANEMLDKAGLKKGADGIRRDASGKPMKYTLAVPAGWSDWISACQIIAQSMKELGITINIETPDQNAWQNVLFRGKHQWALGWVSGGPTPFSFYRGQMSKSTVLPIGEPANENWNRFVNPEADKLLDEFAKTSDEAKQKEIMNQLQVLFVNDAPALPLWPAPDWYEYTTLRFTGWPSKDNFYAPGPPWNSPYGMPHPLLILTTVKPK